MATVYFTGKAYWAKVDRAETHPQYYPDGQWSIQVALDESSLSVLEESGLRLQVREEEEGDIVMFRRPCRKEIKDEWVEFDKPELIDAEGNNITSTNIGNGSDVTVKVAVYDTRFGKGHRLEAVRVDNLIPYEADDEVIIADGVEPY